MPATGPSAYEERRVAPPLWWLGGLALAGLLAAAVHAGGSGPRAVVPYVVAPLLVLAALTAASQGRVRVADGVLHVPGARIPLTDVGEITPLDREGVRQVRGPLAQPYAFVAVRPWQPRAVRVEVVDAQDDTPYWLVGTRDPAGLARVLETEAAALRR